MPRTTAHLHPTACSQHVLEAPQPPSTGALGPAKHMPTFSQPFNFITDDRLQRRHQQHQQQQQAEETFKAMPLNRALLDHPVSSEWVERKG